MSHVTLELSKARKLFSKGPKYREQKKIDFDQAMGNIINGIEDRISTWSQNHGSADAVLLEWKNKLMELSTSSLKTTAIKNGLQHIHDQFLVTPIDKTNGHVVVKNLK